MKLNYELLASSVFRLFQLKVFTLYESQDLCFLAKHCFIHHMLQSLKRCIFYKICLCFSCNSLSNKCFLYCIKQFDSIINSASSDHKLNYCCVTSIVQVSSCWCNQERAPLTKLWSLRGFFMRLNYKLLASRGHVFHVFHFLPTVIQR